MKPLLILFFALNTSFILAQEPDPNQGPIIAFENPSHDFGDIAQGDVVNHVFTFENNGNAPLILSNVLTTCGCTAPEWPNQPIGPGEVGTIKVQFNSTGKVGVQHKTITVLSNAQNARETIKIMTNVMPAGSR